MKSSSSPKEANLALSPSPPTPPGVGRTSNSIVSPFRAVASTSYSASSLTTCALNARVSDALVGRDSLGRVRLSSKMHHSLSPTPPLHLRPHSNVHTKPDLLKYHKSQKRERSTWWRKNDISPSSPSSSHTFETSRSSSSPLPSNPFILPRPPLPSLRMSPSKI